MKHSKLLLGALALSSILVGCPGPAATDSGTPTGDAGRDGGIATPDTGVHDAGGDVGSTDGGTDAFAAADVGVPVTCAGYCTQIGMSCTGTNVQYTDMAACMTACTNAGWTMGTQADTAGNTLGCRVYHSLAALGGATNATTHCPHAGALGGGPNGPCSPWRTEPAAEGAPTTTEGAYVRVDRMGMPAVATALIGPGTMPATGIPALKDAYNDSNPTADAAFVSGVPLLTAIGAFHALLDDDLATAHLTPCSVTHSFPVPGAPAPIPACGVQDVFGAPVGSATATHPVASLVIPDTLRLDTMPADSHFPNGRNLQDDVIDPILSVLLLNLSPCGGAQTGSTCAAHTTATGDHGMAACAADTNCAFNTTAMTCGPAAGTRAATCAGLVTATCLPATGCMPAGSACVPVPCEALPVGSCGLPGCFVSTCGTATPAARCTVGTIGGLPLNPHANDVAYPTTNPFPYFLPHH